MLGNDLKKTISTSVRLHALYMATCTEFTVTRSLMKLFQTGAATVVSDCMNFFHFLPVSHQIDIRTAKFLENFMCSENYICTLFESKLTVT